MIRRHEAQAEEPLPRPPPLLLAEPGARPAQARRRRRAPLAPRAPRRRATAPEAPHPQPPPADHRGAAREDAHAGRQRLRRHRLHGAGGGARGRPGHHAPPRRGRLRRLLDRAERHDRDRVFAADTERANFRGGVLPEGQDADERERGRRGEWREWRGAAEEEERERTDAEQYLRGPGVEYHR